MTEKETVKIINEASTLLSDFYKHNIKLVDALKSAKQIIKELYFEKECKKAIYWAEFNKTSRMKLINKAIKNA